MAARRTIAIALACAATLGASAYAHAQSTSSTAAAASKAWPVTLTPAGQAPEADPMAWSRQEIEAAQARCKSLLNGLDVVAVEDSPLKEGESCGAAVPLRLVSVGRGSNKVTFTPQPTVSCELAAALARWIKHDLQGLARRHLGGPLAQVETMSSYSCRNAYGRKNGRLSEHARANALDISGFLTDRNRVVSIEGNWGLTQREVIANVKRGEALQAAKHIKIMPTEPPKIQSTTVPRQPEMIREPEPTIADRGHAPLPGLSFSQDTTRAATFGFAPPSRLGGPKPSEPVALPGPNAHTAGKLEFVREAHKSACGIFSTTLGPEANRTHLNHFHVDMADRGKGFKVCD